MKTPLPLSLLLALLIGCTLINTNTFIKPTYTAYFFYTIISAIVCIISSLTAIIKRPVVASPIQTKLSVILFTAWVVSYFLQPIICNFPFTIDHAYFLVHLLLLLSLVMMFAAKRIEIFDVFCIISFWTGIESIACILQSIGLIASFNKFFTVTGTWVNPNVTAMFIAMALPAVLHIALTDNRKTYRRCAFSVIILVIITLLLLQCRTAIIGGALASIIILQNHFSFTQKLRLKYGKSKFILLCVIAFITFASLTVYGYYFKQQSADGRLLVWKVCMQLAQSKPLFGYGLGQFERSYNLQQAAYFANGNVTAQEQYASSYIHMAYSEPLQNLVEGGLVSTLLFISILVAALLPKPDKNNSLQIAAYAAITAFAVMSIMNFTVQAIPVMCLFVIYLALHISHSKNNATTALKIPVLIPAIILLISIVVFVKQLRLAANYRQLKKIADIGIKEKRTRIALSKITNLEDALSNESFFQETYARLLHQNHQFEQSILTLDKAIALNADPNLYVQAGHLYAETRQYNKAEQYYMMARNMVPSKLAPVNALMKLYTQAGDTVKASAMANILLQMKPKGKSADAYRYKQDAEDILGK